MYLSPAEFPELFIQQPEDRAALLPPDKADAAVARDEFAVAPAFFSDREALVQALDAEKLDPNALAQIQCKLGAQTIGN